MAYEGQHVFNTRHFVPRNTLLRIYQSLILPYISYGLTAWGLASKSYLAKSIVVQKRELRFIFSVERCEHAVPLFIDAGILPLNFLYFKSVCCLMYDIRNQKVPSNILNLFSDITSIHSYNTRSSSANKLYIMKSRLEIQKRASFSKNLEWDASIIKRAPKKTLPNETPLFPS